MLGLVKTRTMQDETIIVTITMLMCGLLQGSVLGPILFIMYTADLISVIESHGLSPHRYADDTQVGLWFLPSCCRR